MKTPRYATLAAVTILILVVGSDQAEAAAATPPSSQPVGCASLMASDFGNVVITGAETVAAGAFDPPAPGFPGSAQDYASLPEFCRVTGAIHPTPASNIRFEIWLPEENWNGKFMQTGNGGAAGSIIYGSLVAPLMRGYAVANTDTGHQGGGGDFSWAVNQPEKVTDYAHRAVHELTALGKAVTTVRYGQSPQKSYWMGCSTGGRQGLKEAQRYPEDYDAIIAGAPASNWAPLMSLSILIKNNLGPEGLAVDKLELLKEAAIASCDALDGVEDRVIATPAQCDFEPGSLQCQADETAQCLHPNEVEAARRIYAGVIDSAGQVRIPGAGPGSEPLWGIYASPQFSIGASYFQNVVLQGADWDPATFDLEADLNRIQEADAGEHDAMDPDISSFLARGGKLLTYHGTTDGLIPYGNSLNYFESMLAELGEDAVSAGVRYYQAPGMDHCSGGEGAYEVDWLGAMEDWVDRGQPPAELLATHPASSSGTPDEGGEFTRPLCPYPEIARYKGDGDVNQAENFECAAP